MAFTSPGERDSSVFLLMALPDVWRSDRRYGGSLVDWDRFLTGAFIHEMTHAQMLSTTLPRLRALQEQTHSDTLEDDAVQNRFGRDTAFAAAVANETVLLLRAASTTRRGDRAELVRTALASIGNRRQQYYVGDLALWGELEQTFLDLEGVAQWAAFMHARSTSLRNRTLQDALDVFRAGEEYWSQDEGLALYLALDSLVPDWQARVFSRGGPSAIELLRQEVLSRPPA